MDTVCDTTDVGSVATPFEAPEVLVVNGTTYNKSPDMNTPRRRGEVPAVVSITRPKSPNPRTVRNAIKNDVPMGRKEPTLVVMDSRDIKRAILNCIAENAQRNGLGKGRKSGRKGNKKTRKVRREAKSCSKAYMTKLEESLEALSIHPQSGSVRNDNLDSLDNEFQGVMANFILARDNLAKELRSGSECSWIRQATAIHRACIEIDRLLPVTDDCRAMVTLVRGLLSTVMFSVAQDVETGVEDYSDIYRYLVMDLIPALLYLDPVIRESPSYQRIRFQDYLDDIPETIRPQMFSTDVKHTLDPDNVTSLMRMMTRLSAVLGQGTKDLSGAINNMSGTCGTGIKVGLDSLTMESIKETMAQGFNLNLKFPGQEAINNLFSKLLSNWEVVLIALFVSFSAYAWYHRSDTGLALLLGAVSLILFSNYTGVTEYIVEVMERLRRPKTDCEDIHAQFGGVDVDWFTNIGISAMLSAMCKDSFLDSNSTKEMVGKTMKNLSQVKGAASGIEFTIEWFLDRLQNVVNLIRASFLGKDPIQLKSDRFFDVKQYVSRVQELRLGFAAGKRNYETLAQCKVLRAEGLKLGREVRMRPKADADYRVICELCSKLSQMEEYLARDNISINGQRIEPMAIGLMGPPGIGKTVLANYAWPFVSANVLDDGKLDDFVVNRGAYVHTMSQEDDFWSGYRGQMNVIVDEFGFLRDTPGQGSVYSRMIGMVNTNPMNLNMAALEDKGITYFTSELIWWTSNQQAFSPSNLSSIAEPEALHRRLDFTYVVGVSPEYATEDTAGLGPWQRRLDKSKLHLGSDHDFRHLLFYRVLDVGTGKHSETPITYEQWVQNIVDTYTSKRDMERRMLDFVDAGVNSIVRKRRAAAEKIKSQGGEAMDDSKTKNCTCPYCDSAYLRPKAFSDFIVEAGFGDDTDGTLKFMDGTLDGGLFDRMIYESLSKMSDELEGADLFCLRKLPRCHGVIEVKMSHCLNSWVKHIYDNQAREIIRTTPMVTDYCQKVDRFTSGLKIIGSLLLGYGATTFAIKIAKWAYSYFKGEDVTRQSNYTLRLRRVSRKANKVRAQAGNDPNAWNLGGSIMRRNMFRVTLEIPSKPDSKSGGNILFVSGDYAVIPEHFLDTWSNALNIDADSILHFSGLNQVNTNTKEVSQRGFSIRLCELFSRGDPVEIDMYEPNELDDDGEPIKIKYYWDMTSYDCGEHEKDDICLVRFPNVFRARDIVKHFKSRDTKVVRGSGALINISRDYIATVYGGAFKERGYIPYEGHECHNAIFYEINTKEGDCGSPFLVYDKGDESKIASIHIAGSKLGGYGCRVTREAVENALIMARGMSVDFFLEDDDIGSAHEIQKQFLFDCRPSIDMGGAGIICKAKPIPMASKTEIVASPIYGRVNHEPKTKPALLHPVRGIDPMVNARWGYGLRHIQPISAVFEACVDQYTAFIFKNGSSDMNPRVLTFEEAVEGIPGDDFASSLNRSTSPGWPFRLIMKGQGKKEAFGFDGEFVYDNDMACKIKSVVDHIEALILSGKRPFVIFNHFLKDERRPIHKVDEGKTRLISSADVAFAIAIRKYTLMFSVWMSKGRLHNGIAVGVNPYTEWDILAQIHGGGSNNVALVAGDYSSYDKKLSPWFLRSISRAMDSFYNDEGQPSNLIRNALLEEICFSRHLCGDAIYEWIGSNPSGNPLTAIVNSFANNVLLRYAIVVDHFGLDYFSYNGGGEYFDWYRDSLEYLKSSEDVVNITTYGDDNLISIIQGRGYDHIGHSTFTRGLLTLGMTYTDEAKGSTVMEKRNLREVTFLKRGFAQNYGPNRHRWLAPLDIDTIMESIQWTKRKDVLYDHWIDNVHHMIIELSAHGKDVFTRHSSHIRRAVNEVVVETKHVLTNVSWSMAQEELISTEAMY